MVFYTDISNPIAVGFGREDNAEERALYHKEGLPASPCRTDEWKGLTNDVKYITK